MSPALIGEIQKPPLTKDRRHERLDAFFPEKDRFALAMRLNNLLAAPGFEAWMQGEPLDPKKLLYTDEGQAAHLGDVDRAPRRRATHVLRVDAA